MMEERDAWDTILVLKMDRIHRNSRNFMEMMESLSAAEKDFVSATESLDTTTAMGRFVMDIIQRIAQLESEQIGERVYIGMSQKAKTGPGVLGFPAPLGYEVSDGALQINDREAVIVRDIFERARAGQTMEAIASGLNADGVVTKRGREWTAVKIYRITNSTFKTISVYIEGDPRFKRIKKATKPTLFAWAQKEYLNLVRMQDAGVRVPTPIRVEDNVLVMEYIGDETMPAPLLRNVTLDDPQAVLNDVVVNLRAMRKAKLVHADLSEYNLLFWDGRVVVIDVGQSVPIDHPRAAEWFQRDLANIARYFHRLRVDVTPASLERAVLEG